MTCNLEMDKKQFEIERETKKKEHFLIRKSKKSIQSWRLFQYFQKL